MSKAPLLEELLKYHKEENLILSMPGNKSGKAFLRDSLGKKFKETLGDLDITEVDPLDNLHCPEGVIKEAEELLAKTYNVKKAYFLVNGSSSGNLASIFAAFKEGDEVLVERNCHKSIYNGLILRKLKVIYIDAVIDENIGIFLPPREKEINEALSKAFNPKGIIITSPNYFGISYDIENKIKELKEKGLKVIIDSAHGAHFVVNKDLPKSLANLGDYVVLSAHKTLPSLTQGAYLLVNNNEVKSNYKLRNHDEIIVSMPEPIELDVEPEDIDLNIVYEDEDVIVLNKPQGVVVHPAPGNYSGTLVNGLLYHCKDLSGINGVIRPGIVHRIDKDTSGILVIAKNDDAHNHLAKQFKNHSIKREYYALVEGKFSKIEGTVDKPIGRNKKDRLKMAIMEDGKRAVTHYNVLEQYNNGTALVKCTLETGRTHQIRVHMASIGHPLVGDPLYNSNKKQKFKLQGQVLHAKTLGFIHPRSNEYIEFDSELPKYYLELLENIRK